MAAAAKAAFPSTRRRFATLPSSSTRACRTTVASTSATPVGYFGGIERSSRFSAPLDDRMMAAPAAGNGVLGDKTAAVAFLASFLLSRELAVDDADGRTGADDACGLMAVRVSGQRV